ncbi:recombination-associated protein RdgC [Nitrosomonas ureae]|uniref:recombination-associated protein RdgC n=1 Tax=Nitrosomonas ureae TaxID=44577 RepID=UPI001E58AA2F
MNSLEEALSNHALQPCLQMEMQSRGWMTPREEPQNFVHAYGQQWLIALGVEKKLLPAGVINQQAKGRLAKMEQMQGFKPSKKQIRDIKEATIIELMPRAFTQRHKTYAWIDAVKNRLIIDTASTQKADELVEVLVKSMHGLTLAPLETQTSPSSAMTRWLSGTDLPSIFSIDRDCELQGMNDEKATVKYTHHVLEAEETARHIRAGKKVIKLAMTWDSKISFVLHDNLQLRRIVPQDIVKESTEDAEELFVSDFAIMTGELSQLITEMVDALGGEDLS